MAGDDRVRLVAGEAHQFLSKLVTLVDNRRSMWQALHVCPETSEYWEETTDGRYDYLVLTKVSKEYAEAKYGPLPS